MWLNPLTKCEKAFVVIRVLKVEIVREENQGRIPQENWNYSSPFQFLQFLFFDIRVGFYQFSFSLTN
jgi:hypothetical protein